MANSVNFSTSEYKYKYDPIFKDTEYWDTYQSILKQYADGVPDNWFRSFTGQAQSDLYNHKIGLSNALNALLEQKRTDEHNSYSSQVNQMKQAGLNPDLLGVDNAGSTDSASTPNENPMQFENPIPHLTSFLTMVGNAAIGAQSMMSQKIVNDGIRLQNLELADNIVLSELGRANLDFQGADIMPSFKLGFNTGSKHQDKYLEKRATALYDSISHKIATKSYQRDLANVRKETFDITSSPGYSDDDDFYSLLSTKMADAYQRIIDLELSTKSKSLTSEGKYYDSYDSTLKGESENSSNRRVKNKNTQWNEIIEIQSGLIGFIRDEAKKGNLGAIDVLFRIFGEDTKTPNILSIGDYLGLGLQSSNPFK